MSVIVRNYYKRVVAGVITNVNDIKPYWRADVITLLEENGYNVNEDGTVSTEE